VLHSEAEVPRGGGGRGVEAGQVVVDDHLGNIRVKSAAAA
jgi:hypothetical protein